MFFIDNMYEIVRDGTGERFPCRFVREVKPKGDKRNCYLFSMLPRDSIALWLFAYPEEENLTDVNTELIPIGLGEVFGVRIDYD